jgi:AcrR family transcriptional regulator
MTPAQPMRQRILAAAADVLRERGFAETTTKEIARAAGVSEGSLYNHFDNKTALIAATMAELTGEIRAAMAALLGKAGQATVEDNLTELAEAQIRFFLDLLPITGPTLGNRELRDWLREGGAAAGAPVPPGPVLGHAGLIAYIETEQTGGRIAKGAQAPYLAAALLGACQQYAFVTLLTRADVIASVARLPVDAADYARQVVRTLLAGHQGV